MHVILWEYQARQGRETEFEKVYGSGGEWVELFKRGAGYLGTELLRDETAPRRYMTIDRWVSSAAYDTFHQNHIREYEALDARCAELTERETLLGIFTPLMPDDK
jgi:heme-degrading monooxygenase HmoA